MDQENKITEQKTKKDSSKIGAVIILVISALVFLPFGASALAATKLMKIHTTAL